jgi:SulP family sulfate permease
MAKDEQLSGDLWGGVAATLVALPSALAFGVASFAALGPERAGSGALAGLVGAIVAGIIAPPLGGAPRLITVPCAPAAAVLGAFAVDHMSRAGADPASVLVQMTVVGAACGVLQLIYGALGGGTLIKFIPFPVVSGYLSGVGVIIIIKQLPALFGVAHAHGLLDIARAFNEWQWRALLIGTVAVLGTALGSRLTKAAPPAVVGLASGAFGYCGLVVIDPHLRTLAGNQLVIGELPHLSQAGHLVTALWTAASGLSVDTLSDLTKPALTLSVLLSIDTLKTCVVTDAVTRSRHDSNRELRAQGLTNIASSLLGGVPVAGAMGATMVNINSGAKTRRSGSIEGVLLLLAVVLLGSVVAWTPLAALAGILLVVGYRMIDLKAFALLKQPSTRLDFVVIASVVSVAVGVGLITAAGVGLGLAILLFIRDEVRGSVIRRKTYGNALFSKSRRVPEEMAILVAQGAHTVILELQGNLFFGTTDQLMADLLPELSKCRYLILELRRVRSVDYTAVHLFENLEHQLAEHGGHLLFAHLPPSLPTGGDLKEYFTHFGLMGQNARTQIFPELSDALEWAEDQTLHAAHGPRGAESHALSLAEVSLLRGLDATTIAELAAAAREVHLAKGQTLFKRGDAGDELFIIRRGAVRIILTPKAGPPHHVSTIGAGDFFGEMAFLDRGTRSADAVAWMDSDLFVVSRARFEELVAKDPSLGTHVFERLAEALSTRLRYSDLELSALMES